MRDSYRYYGLPVESAPVHQDYCPTPERLQQLRGIQKELTDLMGWYSGAASGDDYSRLNGALIKVNGVLERYEVRSVTTQTVVRVK